MKKIFLLLCVAYIAMSCEPPNSTTTYYIVNSTQSTLEVTFYAKNDEKHITGFGRLIISPGSRQLIGAPITGKGISVYDFNNFLDSVIVSVDNIPKIIYRNGEQGKNIFYEKYWEIISKKIDCWGSASDLTLLFYITEEDINSND